MGLVNTNQSPRRYISSSVTSHACSQLSSSRLLFTVQYLLRVSSIAAFVVSPAGQVSESDYTEDVRMSARRADKEEKPPPATGPGSRVVALPDRIKRHLIPRTSGIKGYELHYSTTSVRALPEELYKNEELMYTVRRLDAPNNRLKRLPETIGDLEGLESIDVQNNSITSLPGTICDLQSLSYLDVSKNAIRKLPAGLDRAAALAELRASNNRHCCS